MSLQLPDLFDKMPDTEPATASANMAAQTGCRGDQLGSFGSESQRSGSVMCRFVGSSSPHPLVTCCKVCSLTRITGSTDSAAFHAPALIVPG